MLKIGAYSNFFFDCDGVILDSNSIKTAAFRETVLRFGEGSADSLVAYHKENGGVSRYEKFRFFQTDILNQPCSEELHSDLLNQFSDICISSLMEAKLVPGFLQFMSLIKPEQCYVVSGSDQEELQRVFRERHLDELFHGIHGSPSSKKEILDEMDIDFSDSIFFGDSKLDYEAAKYKNMKFVFLSRFTEFENWEVFFQNKDVQIVPDFRTIFHFMRYNAQ